MRRYIGMVNTVRKEYHLIECFAVNRNECEKSLKEKGYNVTRILPEKTFQKIRENGTQIYIKKYPNYSWEYYETLFFNEIVSLA